MKSTLKKRTPGEKAAKAAEKAREKAAKEAAKNAKKNQKSEKKIKVSNKNKIEKDPNFKVKKSKKGLYPKKKGALKKESSAQEKANLMTQDPVDNRAATMKKGKAYAKKTGSYKSAEMHYMENELHNKKTGHDVAARYDKKKLGSILSKHMSRNK